MKLSEKVRGFISAPPYEDNVWLNLSDSIAELEAESEKLQEKLNAKDGIIASLKGRLKQSGRR